MTLKYYFHLYWMNLCRSLIARLEYKKDLFIGIFGFLIENVASMASIYFIVRNIPSLAGWGVYQMGFLYGFTMMPIAIDHMLTDELWRVAYFRVKNGDLDRYFLRPQPILFQIIFETFQPEAFGELIVGTAMLIFCGINCGISWSVGKVVLLIVATFVGAVIITAIKIMTTAPAFVLKRSGFFIQILYNFRDYTKYPISIYPSPIRILLTFIVPFGLIISMPVETLMFDTRNPWLLCLAITGFAIVFFALSILEWNLFVRKYESTGS